MAGGERGCRSFPEVTAFGTEKQRCLWPLSPGAWGTSRRASLGALLMSWAGPRCPPPHFKGDCAADVRRLLVHSLARGLYFHNSTQCRGTGIGVSSLPDPLPPLSLCSPPRTFPPSDRRLYNCSAPRGRDSRRGLPSTQGLRAASNAREAAGVEASKPRHK